MKQPAPIFKVLPLTKKEKEVLIAATSMRTYKQIGQALSISAETVRTHIRNIRKKWDLPSLGAVIAAAKELKMI